MEGKWRRGLSVACLGGRRPQAEYPEVGIEGLSRPYLLALDGATRPMLPMPADQLPGRVIGKVAVAGR